MGLAASQAQLLSLTARMSDNELRAQLISNSKMRLASESGQVSERYVQALNDSQLMFTNYDKENSQNYQKLTFNALTSYSQYNNQYGLSTLAGKLLVSELEAKNFTDARVYKEKSLEAFLGFHGLEYDTTYFENLKQHVNEAGHVEYRTTDHLGNVVMKSSGYTPEELKIMYEGEEGPVKVTETNGNITYYGIGGTKLVDIPGGKTAAQQFEEIEPYHQGYDTALPTMKQYEFLVTEVDRTYLALKNALKDKLDAFTKNNLTAAGPQAAAQSSGTIQEIMNAGYYTDYDPNHDYRVDLEALNKIIGSTALREPFTILESGESDIRSGAGGLYLVNNTVPGSNNYYCAGMIDSVNEALAPKLMSPAGTDKYGEYTELYPNEDANFLVAPFRIYMNKSTSPPTFEIRNAWIEDIQAWQNAAPEDKEQYVSISDVPLVSGVTTPNGDMPVIVPVNQSGKVLQVGSDGNLIKDADDNYVVDDNRSILGNGKLQTILRAGNTLPVDTVIPAGTVLNGVTYNAATTLSAPLTLQHDYTVVDDNIELFTLQANGKLKDTSGNEYDKPERPVPTVSTGANQVARLKFTYMNGANAVTANPYIDGFSFIDGTLHYSTDAGSPEYCPGTWPLSGKTKFVNNYARESHNWGGGVYGALHGAESYIRKGDYDFKLEYDVESGLMKVTDNNPISMYNSSYYDALKSLVDSFVSPGGIRNEYDILAMVEAGYIIDPDDAPQEFADYHAAGEELAKFLYGVKSDNKGVPILDAQGNTQANTTSTKYRDMCKVDWVREQFEGSDETLYPETQNALDVIDYYYLDQIMNTYGEPQYEYIDVVNPDENNAKKTQWYTNLFNRMLEGYQALEDGLASSPEWIKYALESGLVKMEQADQNSEWSSFTYNNCVNITEKTDQLAVTQAEAEYKRDMDKIQSKDKRYDMELKNIDTEHNSLQTEYDSIKAAIDKNIERTFKIYSA
ncbi:MAG: hypothetical protein LBK53_02325 [Heliobacteriaceae bacterium]|jgi:hypothetical protein|nr:hypothetical protein [Heliobacteriaceae bacterium]